MTELGFLLDLLLNHRLPKATKDLVANRIKEVELRLKGPIIQQVSSWDQRTISPPTNPAMANQAPSMQAIMARNPDLVAWRHPDLVASEQQAHADAQGQQQHQSVPVPAAIVAQNSATQAAMASRQTAIDQRKLGVLEKGQTSPRKF